MGYLYLCPPLTRLPLHTITLRLSGEGLPGGFEPPLRAAPQNRCGDKPSLPQPVSTERAQVEAASLSPCQRLLWKTKKED